MTEKVSNDKVNLIKSQLITYMSETPRHPPKISIYILHK
jgi:hypothetical protein